MVTWPPVKIIVALFSPVCWTYWFFCTFRTPNTLTYFPVKTKVYKTIISITVQLWLLFKKYFLFKFYCRAVQPHCKFGNVFHEPPSINPLHDMLSDQCNSLVRITMTDCLLVLLHCPTTDKRLLANKQCHIQRWARPARCMTSILFKWSQDLSAI